MKKEFKVGQRVRVYGASQLNFICCDDGTKMIVSDVDRTPWIGVTPADKKSGEYSFHIKQIRRLVPKKKPVAREIYLYQVDNFLKLNSATLNKEIAEEVLEPNEKIITFREVLPNAKLFTKQHLEAIEDACQNLTASGGPLYGFPDYQRVIIKELGKL